MRFSTSICTTSVLASISVTTSLSLRDEGIQRSIPSLTDTAPLSGFDVPTLLAGSIKVDDAIAVEEIRNTLALYPFAIDGKNFAALKYVFASNAIANYSTPLGVLKGLPTIESTLAASLAPVTTQHSYGTQAIDLLSWHSAYSVTYYTASHFGLGPYVGQVLYAYGQYQDLWAKQSDKTWKITHRNLVFMGTFIGNLSVFTYTGP